MSERAKRTHIYTLPLSGALGKTGAQKHHSGTKKELDKQRAGSKQADPGKDLHRAGANGAVFDHRRGGRIVQRRLREQLAQALGTCVVFQNIDLSFQITQVEDERINVLTVLQ